MNIKFYLDKKINRIKGHPLKLYIYINNSDKKFPFTGYYSKSDDWDFNTEEPKKSHPLYHAIMDYLLEHRRTIHKIMNSRDKLTAEQVYNALFVPKSEGIYSFWELRIEEMEKMGKKGNADFYRAYLKSWRSYKKDLSFEEINYNFLTKFKIEKLQTANAVSVNIYLKAIRAIYNEAVKRGVYKPDSFINPFSKIMEPVNASKDKFLTLEEMKIIASKNIDHDFYRYFMLQFLLGGLDFVDLANLKKDQLKNGRLKKVRSKGNTNEIIDNKIFQQAKEILDYYSDDNSDFLLPIHKHSYKHYRDEYVAGIRLILLGAGITSYIGSKTPRYSFIHIASKELRLNRDIIKEIVGHANNDTTSIYEGKYPDSIQDEVHFEIIQSIYSDK